MNDDEPTTTSYVALACEGERCVRLGGLIEGPLAEALTVFEDLAASVRQRRVIGRLVLIEVDTGKPVAARRLWP